MSSISISVNRISAFDATIENTVYFSYSGSQCKKNRIIIYNNSTGDPVYDDTVTSLSLSHIIPAGILTNGNSYYCKITVYSTAYYSDGQGNTVPVEVPMDSSPSNVFKCLSTPIWSFKDLSSSIGSPFIDFSMNYSQAENEAINEYSIAIYTASHLLLWTSGTLYDVTVTTRSIGLANNSKYYIRAYGTTLNGLTLDTGEIEINTSYISPSLYSLAYLENEKYQGCVKIKTNVASIEGTPENGTPVYSNGSIVLEDGRSVIFNDGFSLYKNFILEGVVNNFTQEPFMIIQGNGVELTVTPNLYSISDVDKVSVQLTEKYSGLSVCSDVLDLNNFASYHFWIQRKSGLYNIKIAEVTVV